VGAVRAEIKPLSPTGIIRAMLARTFILCALLAASAVAAEPLAPGATRAESERWLAALERDGIERGAVVRWQYSFASADTAGLEALSIALVRAGYEIVRLGTVAGGATLVVARAELHSPRTLERRGRELAALARTHGARYAGVDAASRVSR
jgi:hypothetical protein